MQRSHIMASKAKHSYISSKYILKKQGGSLYTNTIADQMAIFGPKKTQNITILLITPQFEPIGYTKQPQNHIRNEAWVNFFNKSY